MGSDTIRHDSTMPEIIAHLREAASWYRRHNTTGALTVDVDIIERLLNEADRSKAAAEAEVSP
jgi:hypothetical protein